MKCLICNETMQKSFIKDYSSSEYSEMLLNVGPITYLKCENCGFTISKTHSLMSAKRWGQLNHDFHQHLETNTTKLNQPPYIEQASMLNILGKNNIVDVKCILDYGAGYGSMSKLLKKYYDQDIFLFEPYMDNSYASAYVKEKDLKKYNTVFNSALFEHLLTRESFDKINNLVKNDGAMIIHTVIAENVPVDPNWFYLRPPVHTTFHTNKSMGILMKQWGYSASIYCIPAKSWVLLKIDSQEIKEKIALINKELQCEYFIYGKGFVDYWKGN